jgi:hypothetical protein
MCNMKLCENQNLRWQGKPLWNPSAWMWLHTIGHTASPEGIEKAKLVTARPFTDKDGRAAIEFSVAHQRTLLSTILRLDGPVNTPALCSQLNELRGLTLREIGDMEITLGA